MTQPISCAFSVSGEGPPLILIHGIGASRATWATDMDGAGDGLTLSLSRVAHVASTEAERVRKNRAAYDYYSRFDNIYLGPGIVDAGMIRQIPRAQSAEELEKSLLICTPSQMVDRLGTYADLGIDRVIMNLNFGLESADTLEAIQCFAEEVMPHFTDRPARIRAQNSPPSLQAVL